jgi:hypothetical protein
MDELVLEAEKGYLGPERSLNPMLRAHGPGPEGATCGTCGYLFRKVYSSRTYLKCSLRGGLTRGAATDQRAGWRACALWAEPEE